MYEARSSRGGKEGGNGSGTRHEGALGGPKFNLIVPGAHASKTAIFITLPFSFGGYETKTQSKQKMKI